MFYLWLQPDDKLLQLVLQLKIEVHLFVCIWKWKNTGHE